MNVAQVAFAGGRCGDWAVETVDVLCGDPLPMAPFVSRVSGWTAEPEHDGWIIRSFTSNLRYTIAKEARDLSEHQASLARESSTKAALIPIRKSQAWWAMAQDQRREIYQEKSRHTTIGMAYLPNIARRLHHCRDLGEPFDFITWFEFAEEDTALFNQLLAELRATEEWTFVDREIDIRLNRVSP